MELSACQHSVLLVVVSTILGRAFTLYVANLLLLVVGVVVVVVVLVVLVVVSTLCPNKK